MGHKARWSTGELLFYAALMFIPIVCWCFFFYMNHLKFENGCSGHLTRAGHANTIEAAREEIESAVTFLEKENLTEGYTAIFQSLKTPDEDIGFWYRNLKASLEQLNKIPKDVSALERSNVLLKLRETVIHGGAKGDDIVCPPGLARYPNNMTWIFLLIMCGVMAVGGFGTGLYAIERN